MRLTGKKVALFLEDMYEDNEFWYPYYRMKEEGAELIVVAPEKKTYHGKHGVPASSHVSIESVHAEEFDALIIPGGYSPDRMRRNHFMVEFVRNMHEQKKPIAAICHAGWMLVSAGILKGKDVTSFYAIKDDLINAGASWVDQEVVEDSGIITSRNPNDLPAFCAKLIEILS